MIEQVAFSSEGATLRGLLLRPDSRATPPIVIMTHGTSATIRMVADEYAEVFRRNGLAALLYDHRNLGASDGEPRQEINPWIQCRGCLDAIGFVQTLDGIDRNRIGLWGGSLSTVPATAPDGSTASPGSFPTRLCRTTQCCAHRSSRHRRS